MKRIVILSLILIIFLCACSFNTTMPPMVNASSSSVILLFSSTIEPTTEPTPRPTPIPTQTFDASMTGNVIEIISVSTSEANSAGGVDLYIQYKNISDKIIDKITFSIEALDENDSPAKDEITGSAIKNCSITGPMKPDIWDADYPTLWYNKAIVRARIVSICITYTDFSYLMFPAPTPEPEPPTTPKPDPYIYDSVLKVLNVSVSNPNSAGGVNCTIKLKNTSKKVINYVEFTIDPINGVGDPIGDVIDPAGPDPLIYTGPLSPGKTVTKTFRNAWYNEETKYVALTGIVITYSDDSEFIIPDDVIPLLNIKGNYIPNQ